MLTATGGSVAGMGAIVAIAVLLPMEAGIPIPLPSDLVMLAVGARVGSGHIPLWVGVLAFEAIAVIGTTVLLVGARGPGHSLVQRFGPRIGLTPSRLQRAGRLLERRGRPALAVGRATPGLRTVTVVAAGGTGLSLRQALPALVLGSSIFLQLHLFLGYFLGNAASATLRAVSGPALGVLAVVVVAAVFFWLLRRGRRAGAGGLLEGACPACLALAALSEHPGHIEDLVGRDA